MTPRLAVSGYSLFHQKVYWRYRPVPCAGLFGRESTRAGCRGQDARQLGAQEPLSLPRRNAALQQEGADLIDNAGALADQALPYPVQRLQVELIRGLGRHEFHGWS